LFPSIEIEISEACKIALFEVLCIYNSNNLKEKIPLDELFYERASNTSNFKNDSGKSTWK
jgi:hypothetical protein